MTLISEGMQSSANCLYGTLWSSRIQNTHVQWLSVYISVEPWPHLLTYNDFDAVLLQY